MKMINSVCVCVVNAFMWSYKLDFIRLEIDLCLCHCECVENKCDSIKLNIITSLTACVTFFWRANSLCELRAWLHQCIYFCPFSQTHWLKQSVSNNHLIIKFQTALSLWGFFFFCFGDIVAKLLSLWCLSCALSEIILNHTAWVALSCLFFLLFFSADEVWVSGGFCSFYGHYRTCCPLSSSFD